jgi:hypothetical protein
MLKKGEEEKHWLENGDLAELLAREAERRHPPASKALRRAARIAHLWPEEAADLIREGRALLELPAVGPFIADLIRRWIEDPPEIPKRPPIREDFLTIPQARRMLARDSTWLPGI